MNKYQIILEGEVGWRDLLLITYKYLSSFLNISDLNEHLKAILFLLSMSYVALDVLGLSPK